MVKEEEGNSITSSEQEVNDAVFDSDNFFDELENSVNGMQSDGEDKVVDTNKVTQDNSGSEMVTRNNDSGSEQVEWENENNPYKKRYTDSSREATKMYEELRDLKPFVPVLEAMKRDSGLVDHVRSYLKNGGAPNQSIQEKLNLPKDFEYDANEAITDPESDSAKVQQAHIDSLVQSRVNQVLTREKANAQQMQQRLMLKKQEVDFIKKHNMTQEQFEAFKNAAANRKMTLDDAYYIINKDKTNTNVANSTKKDMLNQMKNVRNIPTSASDSNNQGNSQKSPDQKVFDSMLGLDNDVDNLFG
tara:strand:- start:7348 stop:8253 length:906 start_codon:yes stop_codon:yes gene_type:complete